MIRSLFSGVTGLRNHQLRLDVIGNNVANVNTTAFKSGRVAFKEGFAQLVSGATRPPGNQGGVNPVQVGLGSQVASVDTLFSQGNVETTGIGTDLAIQGNSFFVVSKGNQFFYTRAGNFQLDADGRLVSPANGFVVQGRVAVNGTFQDGIQDIRLPFGQKTAALPTSNTTLAGNLDAAAQVFDQGTAATVDPLDPSQRQIPGNERSYKDVSITVYDSLGEQHELKMVLYKSGPSEWSWQIDPTGMDIDATFGTAGISIVGGTNPFTFLPDGTLDTNPATFVPPQISFRPNSGAADVTITIDPRGAGVNGLTQFAGTHNSVLRDQDGYTSGSLQSFSIDRTGTIVGSFTNGTTQPLGQIVLSDFNNPGGLMRVGDNMYSTSGNSGSPVYGFALEGAQSEIVSGALEMSNVDLAQEFTSMIVAERGYQANSRVITTSDRLLEELVNMKR
ncbi:MAG: flagellar hook protein FlgE [Gemmatimonadales bacterium]|nr:flagellar hook protein FlgE [Gemmatimonadota bacterium]MCL4214676.1 flagellar hook protein FlgE [Gemmatimonadales bacterium]